MSLHNYTVPVLYVYKLHLLDYKLAGPRMYYTGDYDYYVHTKYCTKY